jgi:hypothetical protein
MSATNDTGADLAAIRSDLSNLKGDVASLIEHFTGEVGSGVQGVSIKLPTVFGASLRTPPRTAIKPPRRLAFGFERRPLLSLGIALGVGYVGARAFSPRDSPPSRAISSNSRPSPLTPGSFR